MAFDFNTFYSEVILNKIIASAIIFFLGFMFGKVCGKLLKRFLSEIDLNDKFLNIFLNKINIEQIISKTIEYTIYIITIIITLNKIGLTNVVIKGILIFSIALILFTLILDLKELIPNIFSYIQIKREKYFKVGDKIKIHLATGVVKKISFIRTKIVTEANDELYIQNHAILENFSVEKKW